MELVIQKMNERITSPSESGGNRVSERIRDAYIKYKGEFFYGTTHGHAFGSLLEKYPDANADDVEDLDGFITSTGRHVNRTEALRIARFARQLDIKDALPNKTHLYSENIKETS